MIIYNSFISGKCIVLSLDSTKSHIIFAENLGV